MSLGQRHWTTRWISQVLCCILFLETGTLAAGQLPAPPERREWMSDKRLAALVKADLPLEVAETEEAPEPVRIAALQEKPSLPKGVSPSSILTDAANEAAIPAVRPKPLEEREVPPAPVEVRPEDLPPFPPGMEGAVVPRTPAVAASTLQALTASSLIPSWNLASVQNEPVDKSPASVFSPIAGRFTRVYSYNACTPADPWKVYDPADAPGSDLTQVDQKIGFWIEMTAPATVPNPGSLANETTIHLCVGWNLIGFPAGQARPVRTALSSIEGKYTRVFGFDPADAADPWELYDVAVPSWANDLDLMQPGRGYWVLATAETDLKISNAGAEPEVAITAPADLGLVTTFTDVIGTVRSDRLQSWTLSYRPHGEAQETVFATGSAPVVNGRLGNFDPTLLLNGGYTIELTATDFNGQSSTVDIDVAVEGQQKVGNFTLRYLDLEIPLSGLPIQVIRTYDSRDKRRGDFGVGWALELKQGSYRNNRKPGDGWQISSGFLPCQTIQETEKHVTTIRLSDQEVYRFRLALTSPAPTLGGCFAQAQFNFVDGPVPGATLAILGNSQVIYQNDTDFVIDSSEFEMYEPDQVRLTTRDGRIFDLSLQQGVTRIQDLKGNTVSITPTAVTHSTGLSVAFQRDGLGRITRITDPEGASLAYAYDAAGDLVSVTDRGSNTTTFTYNGDHHLLNIEDPLGRQPVRNEYDGSGRLVRTTDAFGKSVEFDHRLGDRQDIVTDRLGHSRVLEYDARGNVVREVDPAGKETLRTFDAKDRLLSETDPLGNKTVYTYDAAGNRTSVTDPEGNRTDYTYNARGQMLTVTDPRGKVTTNVYDAGGNLTSVTDPLGHVTQIAYNSRGDRTSVTDPEGNVSEAEYDAYGNVQSETDPEGAETVTAYDRNGNPTAETLVRTVPGGTETMTRSFTYDALGRQTAVTETDGATTGVVYDAVGRVAETVDPLGRRTVYIYDPMGRLTGIDHPDGTSEETAYDAEGRKTSHVDRAGRTTRFEYDLIGRLVRTIHPDNAVESRDYDGAGRLIAETDARGNVTRYEYDRAGRRTRLIDALGRATVYGYDPAGNRASVTDPKGQTTTYEYDGANRLARVRYPDGASASMAYDRAGRKVSETDPAGKTTVFEYDGAGRLTSVKDPLNQVTRYTYDEMGNRVSQTDPNGKVTLLEYDRAGRLTKRTLPLGSSEILAYDLAGRLTQRTNHRGGTLTYGYDLADRLISKGLPDGSTVAYTYTPAGERASVTDGQGTTAYGYDSRDRLTSLVYPDGRSLAYGYDLQGNRTSLTARIGAVTLTTTYSHDGLNRLATVVDPQGRTYTHGYDANGNRASLAYPNGVATSYEYDVRNHLTHLTTRSGGAVVQSYAYTLGPAGNRQRVDEADGTVREYTYDDLYRLTGETVRGTGGVLSSRSFAYDPAGNRRSQDVTDSGGTSAVSYAYDDRDRLLTEGGSSYSSDADGNVTGRSGPDAASYAWDGEDRLTSVTLADGTVVTHAYDADGNRVRTEITPANGPPQVTEYLVDPSGGLSQVVAESDGAGILLAYYVRGDELLAAVRPGGTRFYHADGLGSIRRLTDETGAVTDTYDFSAFGELAGHTGSDPNAYLFAGEPLDPNSGFYYLRARWMDPRTGRFASVDPMDPDAFEPATLHRYVYALNDPVDLVDPTGLYTQSFGYDVEAAIEPLYMADHPGHVVTFGRWANIGSNPRLKPDILNHTTHEVMEIKPFSFRGIAAGAAKIVLYAVSTGYSPDTVWSPPGFLTVQGTPVLVFNVEGVLFYTDAVELQQELAAVTAITALYALLRHAKAAKSAFNEVAYIYRLVAIGNSAQGARMEGQLSLSFSLAAFGIL